MYILVYKTHCSRLPPWAAMPGSWWKVCFPCESHQSEKQVLPQPDCLAGAQPGEVVRPLDPASVSHCGLVVPWGQSPSEKLIAHTKVTQVRFHLINLQSEALSKIIGIRHKHFLSTGALSGHKQPISQTLPRAVGSDLTTYLHWRPDWIWRDSLPYHQIICIFTLFPNLAGTAGREFCSRTNGQVSCACAHACTSALLPRESAGPVSAYPVDLRRWVCVC